MILQCDQCQTKFRLDDSKLKPGGVKVRCSKCRHVFLAGAELKQEESEFDALLSGLGAPAPEKREEPAAEREASAASALFGFDDEPAPAKAPEPPAQPQPAAAQPDLSDLGSLEFPAEAFANYTPEKPAPPEEQMPDFGDFDFNDSATQQQAQVSQGVENGAVAEAARGTGLDFGEFSFESEPEVKAEASPAAAEAVSDFGEFDFDATPPQNLQQQPRAAADAFDFGEFSFNEEPAPVTAAEQPRPAADTLDFGEFTFNEEPAPVTAAEQPRPATDALDFGEFTFKEEPAPAKAPEQPQTAADGLDFGEFTFNEEPAPAAASEQPQAASEMLDFGEFTFSEEPAPSKATGEPQPAADAVDFGEFAFNDEAAPKSEEASGTKADALDFGDFTFDEAPAAAKGEPAPAGTSDELDYGDFSFGEEPPPVKEEPLAASDDFASFSFGDEAQQGRSLDVESDFAPELPAPGQMASAGLAAATVGAAGVLAGAGPAVQPAAGVAPPASPAAAAKAPAKESPFDFSFGPRPDEPSMPEEFDEDEELPPLGITSRRKGRSALTVSVIAVSVVVILALSAAGIYLMKSGPAAMEKLDQFGIGFVADWLGIESPEEGRITVRNPVASFHQNKEAGELFVVTGEAVNSFRKARASVQVRVSLFDKSGAVLMQKTAYCGNRLTDDQLATLPMAKIESIMNNQFGDSLANLGVKPGQPIGFVVALANVPKEAVDFGVEVVGSTVAGQ